MKNSIVATLLCLSALSGQAKTFPETWAYLMKGEEKLFPAASTITDVACFSAAVDSDGRLSGGHLAPPALPGANAGTRYHLVVTIPWSTTLAHIYLNPQLPFRSRIIADIVERSKPFAGLQIDIESVSAKDGTAYLNFLAAVKKALPKDKIFSVAVMARWAAHKQTNPDDAFDYPFISMIADRVVVMAYDEHYRSGAAGPVASLPWCKKIYDYALQTIDPNKLVMGVPLYGRGWQTPSLAKAYKNSEVANELREKRIQPSNDRENGGFYSFQETVTVDVHFETLQSLEAKLNLYVQRPIRGVAFWRVGQEPAGLWGNMR
ncbi:glycosyl hydrolase family 18 protein [Pontiella sulfatireligans]|uniref:Spore germination protein YaaH n=1 Tax=Pontiella sulfatireligans TaxID=2750658 RepID=A0A6C2UL15_9BACT|nr:glycosyl hydrolase family 18 protein [Pontiella sulfatireligans]VGO20932.1 Spore germination protein YaaH [Pontiella sulfatireligans]